MIRESKRHDEVIKTQSRVIDWVDDDYDEHNDSVVGN